MDEWDELLSWIEDHYTPCQLVKTLDLDIADVIVALEEHIQDNKEIFEMQKLGLIPIDEEQEG